MGEEKIIMDPKYIGYLIGIILLLVGIAGIYLDPCGNKICCQSFVQEMIRSGKCAEITYYGERPWSVEMFVAGIFVLVATRLLTK